MTFSTINNKSRFLVILVVALVGGAFYLKLRSDHGIGDSSAGVEMPVRIAQVRRASIPLTLKVAGELLPLASTDVVSRLAGKVAEVRFKAGDFVPAGAIVATIRASDLEHRLGALGDGIKIAKQDLASKEKAFSELEKRLSEDRELLRRDLISRSDVERVESSAETARAQAELARAHVAQQEAMLDQARALQGLTRLVAPFNGEVSGVLVKPGAAIGEGGVVLSIVRLDVLKLVAGVSDPSVLRLGMKARIFGASGIVSEGRVVRFRPEKDGEGKTEAEIHVDNEKRILRAGMSVEGLIDLGREGEALLIPRSAAFSENNSEYVYKLSAGRAARHRIVLGSVRGDEIAVTQGISSGDEIIVDWKGIKPGTRVRGERADKLDEK